MDNEKELVRFILQYLLDNHFESKSDMARQLDIRHRTMQRVFEQLHNDKAKGSTIVLDRALLFCAKRKISVDQLFREYQDFHQGSMLEPATHEEDVETMPSAHDLCLPDIESLPCASGDKKKMTEHYNQMMSPHTCRSLAQTAKSIYLKYHVSGLKMKLPNSTEAIIYKKASELLLQELSVSLGEPIEAVQKRIEQIVSPGEAMKWSL